MTQDTRTRMIHGAALLVGTHGAKSASLRDLAREAGVPLGSTYHYFPDGKAQLVEEAVTSAGERVQKLIARAQHQGPDGAMDAMAKGWRAVLETTDFRSGCPVLAVALEDDAALRKTATEIFDRWQVSLITALIDNGVSPKRAPRMARTVVAAIEGAIALCRAERSFDPLEDVLAELRVMLAQAAASA